MMALVAKGMTNEPLGTTLNDRDTSRSTEPKSPGNHRSDRDGDGISNQSASHGHGHAMASSFGNPKERMRAARREIRSSTLPSRAPRTGPRAGPGENHADTPTRMATESRTRSPQPAKSSEVARFDPFGFGEIVDRIPRHGNRAETLPISATKPRNAAVSHKHHMHHLHHRRPQQDDQGILFRREGHRHHVHARRKSGDIVSFQRMSKAHQVSQSVSDKPRQDKGEIQQRHGLRQSDSQQRQHEQQQGQQSEHEHMHEHEQARASRHRLESLQRQGRLVEDEVQKNLVHLSDLGHATTRRLDYSHYALLTSLRDLTNTVNDLRVTAISSTSLKDDSLSRKHKLFLHEIDPEVQRMQTQVEHQVARTENLQNRMHNGLAKVDRLSARLDHIKSCVTRAQESDARHVEQIKRRWRTARMSTLLFIAVLILAWIFENKLP